MPWITALAALATAGVALEGARGMLPMPPRSVRAIGWMSAAMAVMATAMLSPHVLRVLPTGALPAVFLLFFALGLYYTTTSARAGAPS